MIQNSPPLSTATYSSVGLTASARFEGSVQGVVVQARRRARLRSSLQPAPGGSGSRRKATVSAGFRALAIGIVELGLEIGERRLHGPGVGHHPIALVDEVFFPQSLEGPHHAFHEAFVHGAVGSFEAHPAGGAIDVKFPLVCIALHRELALGVEFFDAIFEDRRPAEDLDFLFNLKFRRQAVAIPAEPAIDMAAAHRLVSRYDILHEAGGDVPIVREAIGERRAVVKDEFVRASIRMELRPHRDLFLEGPLASPCLQNFLLDRRKARRLIGVRIEFRLREHQERAFEDYSAWRDTRRDGSIDQSGFQGNRRETGGCISISRAGVRNSMELAPERPTI